MNPSVLLSRLATIILCFCTGVTVLAQSDVRSDSERLRELEEIVRQLRQQNQLLLDRVGRLERDKGTGSETMGGGGSDPSAVTSNQWGTNSVGASSPQIMQALKSAPERAQPLGQQTPVTDRAAFQDEQVSAPRPGDLTLDPKYRGFFPIPNTPVLVKVNAKPRVDFISDTHSPGDSSRFRPGQIPTEGNPNYSSSSEFNVSAQGSRLMLDVRAPETSGHPRFYYENDFFGGSGDAMSLRVRHLYGQVYNVVLGQTWSTFVDPDAFPDTVDYELANSSILTRSPLIRYIQPLNEQWQLNIGIEAPESKVDAAGSGGSGKDRAPDFGANVRWEKAGLGHVQLSGVMRMLGISGGSSGDQEVFGRGLNLSGALSVFGRDNLIGQITYGHGIGRYGHDSSAFNTDATLNASGDLVALPYFGVLAGYTHRWSDRLRSSLTYGYIMVDNESGQAATAYHRTHYGALNLIWQPFESKRLNAGIEGLYGVNEVNNGDAGDDLRVQIGLIYSLF